MSARDLTLTSIGLPVRSELRLKSLLESVNARTTDRWSFTEQSDAHVAICDPASALSTITMKRLAGGSTRFFSLVEDVSLAAEGTSAIRDPIRASELIEVLNLVSSTLSCEAPRQEWAALSVPTAMSSDGRDVFPVAVALRGLARGAQQSAYLLHAGGIDLHVFPERTVLIANGLDHEDVSNLAAPGVPISIRELPAAQARALAEAGAQKCKVDALLWRLGLRGEKSRLLPELPANAHFKLRRWPDFGRLEHTADHLRLAARLTRQKATVLELAIAAALPVSTINACCLCELLQIHPAGNEKGTAKSTGASEQTSRYVGILRAIRSVLRIGSPS